MDENMNTPTPEYQPQQEAPAPELKPEATTPPNQPEPAATQSPPASPTPTATSTEEISKDAKQWGMFCHLAGLAGYLPILPYPIGNILGTLILWLIKKDDFKFVDDQGKEALNFQITISICILVCIPLCFIVIGLILLPAVFIFNIVMIIIASIEANKGKAYRYPFSFRLVK